MNILDCTPRSVNFTAPTVMDAMEALEVIREHEEKHKGVKQDHGDFGEEMNAAVQFMIALGMTVSERIRANSSEPA